jgi:hypothetical protein
MGMTSDYNVNHTTLWCLQCFMNEKLWEVQSDRSDNEPRCL